MIEQSYNLSGEKVAAGQVALSRMNEEEFPQSSLEFAMQKIKMDSNVALMTQAKDMSKKDLFVTLVIKNFANDRN